MAIIDISVPISNNTVVYPGDPRVEIIPDSLISKGESANVSMLRLGTHTGTHVDPPNHMIDGAPTVDQLPLDILIGTCFVCDVGQASVITTNELLLAKIPPNTKRILFKTRNSEFWSNPTSREDFTYLDSEAAGWLVEHGVRLVGIDSLSIDRLHSGSHPTHMRLFESGVVNIEGLDLRGVSGGIYTLVCLPLRIAGGDGSPARAVLITDYELLIESERHHEAAGVVESGSHESTLWVPSDH